MMFGKKDKTPESSDGLFKATREIAACFTEKNWKFDTKRLDNMCVLESGMRGTNVNAIKIVFISTNDNSDVAIRSFGIVPQIPEEKKVAILEAINNLNSKYRFAKFVLENNSTVNVAYDIPMTAGEIGEMAMEIFVRFVQIIDESYPELMKTLWS